MHRLKLDYKVLGPIATNVYFAGNPETNECVIIDPAAKAGEIISKLQEDAFKPVAILLTHGHFDHIMAVNELKEKYGIPVYAHEAESEMLAHPSAGFFPRSLDDKAVTEYIPLKDGQVIELIGYKWTVIHTPGHSAGSVCYYIPEEQVMFSGDTLFRRSYGRTDLETGSYKEIIDSLVNKLFKIDDDAVEVFPGHGESTDLGYEKQYNDILIDR